MSDDLIIGFGVERMHFFDRKTQKFTARCYDFEFDYDEVPSSIDNEAT
jgi:hypothetical protein